MSDSESFTLSRSSAVDASQADSESPPPRLQAGAAAPTTNSSMEGMPRWQLTGACTLEDRTTEPCLGGVGKLIFPLHVPLPHEAMQVALRLSEGTAASDHTVDLGAVFLSPTLFPHAPPQSAKSRAGGRPKPRTKSTPQNRSRLPSSSPAALPQQARLSHSISAARGSCQKVPSPPIQVQSTDSAAVSNCIPEGCSLSELLAFLRRSIRDAQRCTGCVWRLYEKLFSRKTLRARHAPVVWKNALKQGTKLLPTIARALQRHADDRLFAQTSVLFLYNIVRRGVRPSGVSRRALVRRLVKCGLCRTLVLVLGLCNDDSETEDSKRTIDAVTLLIALLCDTDTKAAWVFSRHFAIGSALLNVLVDVERKLSSEREATRMKAIRGSTSKQKCESGCGSGEGCAIVVRSLVCLCGLTGSPLDARVLGKRKAIQTVLALNASVVRELLNHVMDPECVVACDWMRFSLLAGVRWMCVLCAKHSSNAESFVSSGGMKLTVALLCCPKLFADTYISGLELLLRVTERRKKAKESLEENCGVDRLLHCVAGEFSSCAGPPPTEAQWLQFTRIAHGLAGACALPNHEASLFSWIPAAFLENTKDGHHEDCNVARRPATHLSTSPSLAVDAPIDVSQPATLKQSSSADEELTWHSTVYVTPIRGLGEKGGNTSSQAATLEGRIEASTREENGTHTSSFQAHLPLDTFSPELRNVAHDALDSREDSFQAREVRHVRPFLGPSPCAERPSTPHVEWKPSSSEAFQKRAPLNESSVEERISILGKTMQRYFCDPALRGRVVFSRQPPPLDSVSADSPPRATRSGSHISGAALPPTLQFSSSFEGGNLELAVQMGPVEYDLVLSFDVNTTSFTQWFYFSVENMVAGVHYTFNIINMEKKDSCFNEGQRPLMFSEKQFLESGGSAEWERCGTRIMYYANSYYRPTRTAMNSVLYTNKPPQKKGAGKSQTHASAAGATAATQGKTPGTSTVDGAIAPATADVHSDEELSGTLDVDGATTNVAETVEPLCDNDASDTLGSLNSVYAASLGREHSKPVKSGARTAGSKGTGSCGSRARKSGDREKSKRRAESTARGSGKAAPTSTPTSKGTSIVDGGRHFYSLTFSLQFPRSGDRVYLANCFPYVYTDLVLDIEKHLREGCAAHTSNSSVSHTTDTSGNNGTGSTPPSTTATLPRRVNHHPFLEAQTMCYTLGGNAVPLLTITESTKHNGEPYTPEEIRQRPVCVITARVHPGESNGSFMMRGLINFLCDTNLPASRTLRENVVWKLVPMLNPDGCINGNHRCSLAGQDMNRDFASPDENVNPTNHRLLQLVDHWRNTEGRNVCLYGDFHGHSRCKNFVLYGCNLGEKFVRQSASGAAHHATAAEPSVVGIVPEKLLPRVLSLVTPLLDYEKCTFALKKDKDTSGRAAFFRARGVRMSYAMEGSMMGGYGGRDALCGPNLLMQLLAEMACDAGAVPGTHALEEEGRAAPAAASGFNLVPVSRSEAPMQAHFNPQHYEAMGALFAMVSWLVVREDQTTRPHYLVESALRQLCVDGSRKFAESKRKASAAATKVSPKIEIVQRDSPGLMRSSPTSGRPPLHSSSSSPTTAVAAGNGSGWETVCSPPNALRQRVSTSNGRQSKVLADQKKPVKNASTSQGGETAKSKSAQGPKKPSESTQAQQQRLVAARNAGGSPHYFFLLGDAAAKLESDPPDESATLSKSRSQTSPPPPPCHVAEETLLAVRKEVIHVLLRRTRRHSGSVLLNADDAAQLEQSPSMGSRTAGNLAALTRGDDDDDDLFVENDDDDDDGDGDGDDAAAERESADSGDSMPGGDEGWARTPSTASEASDGEAVEDEDDDDGLIEEDGDGDEGDDCDLMEDVNGQCDLDEDEDDA